MSPKTTSANAEVDTVMHGELDSGSPPNLSEPQYKNFSVRNIPPKLHHLWKVTAALHDVSMEKLALIAIRDYCKAQLEEMREILDDPSDADADPDLDPDDLGDLE